MPPINNTGTPSPSNATNPNRGRGHRGAPQISTGLRSPDMMDVRLGMATKDGRERDEPVDPNQVPQVSQVNPKHLKATLVPIEERIQHAQKSGAKHVFKFRSRNRYHTVLLEAYPDKMLPNGRIEKGFTVLAKFKDGEYRTEDPEHAYFLVSNKRGYGMHLDYWDAEEEDQAAAVATYNAFRDQVKSNPELYQMFLQDMAAGDFDLAAAEDRGYDEGGQPLPKGLKEEVKGLNPGALDDGQDRDLRNEGV